MIIVIKESEINEKALRWIKSTDEEKVVSYYSSENVFESHDKSDQILTILELDLNNDLEADLISTFLAKDLINQGLPKTIKKIRMVVCDTNNFMRTYGESFYQELSAKGYDVEVNIIADYQYSGTFLVPPVDETDWWKIYGIHAAHIDEFRRGVGTGDDSFAPLLSFKEKELIYEGRSIKEWLENDSRTFSKELTKNNTPSHAKFTW